DLPQALEQFYHTHLSASGVLGSQYEVLLEQSKRLYGGKEEFEEHNLALKKATDSRLGQLEDVHTFGPIRPGETEGKKEEEIKERMAALDRQRQIEQANLKNLQVIAHSSSEKDRARNLKMAMDTLFNREWERREQQDALLDQFAEEFKVYAKNIYQPRESIIEEFGTGVAAVTLTEQAYMQERGTTQVTQGPTFAQQQSGGSNVASNVTQKAKDIGNKIRKKLARKTEEELAEKALEKGAEQAAATGVRAFLAANPEILLIILLVIAAFLLIFIVII